jgi:hypothetical protein
LNNAGQLVGVNAFHAGESQGLNYAVSATDVRVFMQRAANRIAERVCDGKVTFEGRNKENNADLKAFDEDCDGKADYMLVRPDNKAEPIYVLVDSDHNGEPEGEIDDQNRDGKWDISFWDENGDGKPDLVGHHPDGEAEPSSFSKYMG